MNPHSLLYVPTELLQHDTRPGPVGESHERGWALLLVGLVVSAGLLAALLPG